MERLPAFFLWVGGPMPDLARLSVLSAAEAGFETVLFTDRPQTITHPHLTLEAATTIYDRHRPEDFRIRGRSTPAYTAYANIFRYALLSRHEGWWFDCDTVLLKEEPRFRDLVQPGLLTLAHEDGTTINQGVIGSRAPREAGILLVEGEAYGTQLPQFGITGPRLVSRLIAAGRLKATVLGPESFYPVHFSGIDRLYLPEECETMRPAVEDAHCLSLWGEVLARTGLRHLAPPRGSLLAEIADRFDHLVRLKTDEAGLARYLSANMGQLEALESGSAAFRTVLRKGQRRVLRALRRRA